MEITTLRHKAIFGLRIKDEEACWGAIRFAKPLRDLDIMTAGYYGVPRFSTVAVCVNDQWLNVNRWKLQPSKIKWYLENEF